MSTLGCGAAIKRMLEVSNDDIAVIESTLDERTRAGVPLATAQKQAIAEAIAQLGIERKNIEQAITEQHPDAGVGAPSGEQAQAGAATTQRFEAGSALTKAQRKQVLATLVDVYKAKGAPREQKGVGRDGNERYGYVHSPDLFEKSDITGAMVRYHVTLPDGRLAHPSELFPDYTQSDIDTEVARREHEAKGVQSEVTRMTAPAQQFGSVVEAGRFWDDKSDESLRFNGHHRTILPSLERTTLSNGGKFIMVPDDVMKNGAMVEAFADAGWMTKAAQRAQSVLTSPTPGDILAQQAQLEAEQQRQQDGGDKPITRPASTADQIDLLNPQGGIFDAPADHSGGADEKVTPGKINDLGEKIGGARKDTAESGGARTKSKEVDERPTWAKRFEVSQIIKAGGQVNSPPEEGRWVIHDKRTADFMGRPKQVGRSTFATKEEAEAFLPMAAVALKHRVVGTSEGKYEIWRTVTDRKRVKVVDKAFETREAAMEYLAQHAVEILETNTTFGETDLPLPPDRARTGPERRSGNVNGDNFMEAFGFRGVEFGNWNNQEERQALMNEAYDGLMDLADVLGVPPKALGLNGDLALAFGARGQGLNSARAHYEMERAVINLTKEHGAGSLAHEWFHAFDAYLGRQDGKASSQWIVNEDGTRRLKVSGTDANATHGFRVRDSGVRPELRAAYEKLVNTIFKKGAVYVEDATKADAFAGRARTDLEQELGKLRAELAEQKNPEYWKRNNKPAAADQLAEFDTIAQQMLEGQAQALATDWRKIEGSKAKIAARWTNDGLERLNAIYKAVRGRTGFDSQNQHGWMDKLRGTMNRYSQRLKMLADAQAGAEKTKTVPTEFAMNAKELDQGRGGDYWTSPHEMAARAFQGYVEDKIAERGGVSRFLNYAPENGGIITPWGVKFPYPRGEERKAINTALDALVGTIQTKETDSGVAMFRRGTADADAAAALKREAVEKVVHELTRSWLRKPQIEIIDTMADAPEAVRAQYEAEAQHSEAANTVHGFHLRGTVYLVADALHSRQDVITTLLHESLGHFGLRGFFGKALNPILEEIVATRKFQVIKKARAYGLDMAKGADRLMAAEEVLAELAQTRPDLSLVQRAIAAIRTWLRTNVPGFADLALSDAEIIRSYILPARGFVERGLTGKPTYTRLESPAFSHRMRPSFISALEQRVAQGPNQAPATEWGKYINALTSKGVTPSEVEWSGVTDWLQLQDGKVTKDQVLAYLNDSGVRVQEVVKGEQARTNEADQLRVELDALGFTVGTLDGDSGTYMIRRSDGKKFVYDSSWDSFIPEEDVDTDKDNRLDRTGDEKDHKADELGRIYDRRTVGDDFYDREGDPAATRYERFKQPGGENYREVLLTLPKRVRGATKDEIERLDKRLVDRGFGSLDEEQRAALVKGGNDAHGMLDDIEARVGVSTKDIADAMAGGNRDAHYRSSHWDEPNVLAHIRLTDRTDADGKKVLFVEEIQSDWAQEGRKRGFDTKATPEEVARDLYSKDYNKLDAGERESVDAEVQARNEGTGGAAPRTSGTVPRAPFVEKTDAWVSLALKKVLQMATEGGYDSVALVNGQQAADNFDLSKHISSVRFEDNHVLGVGKAKMEGPHTTGRLIAHDLKGSQVINKHIEDAAKELPDIIGKDAAAKLLEQPATSQRTGGGNESRVKELKGLDLKVGGEGMKGFYDGIVPTIANKLLAKLGGGKLADVRIPKTEAKVKDISYADLRENLREVSKGDMGYEEFYENWPDLRDVVSEGDLEDIGNRDPHNRARTGPMITGLVDKVRASIAAGKSMKQTGFDITDSMREKVRQGLPQFSKKIGPLTDADRKLAAMFAGNDKNFLENRRAKARKEAGDFSQVPDEDLLGLTKPDPEDDGVAFLKTTMAGPTTRQYTPDQLAAMDQVGFRVEVPSLKDRAQAIWKNAGNKLAQGIVDQFAPVKDLDKAAYGLLRLSKGASGAFEVFMRGGKLKLSDNVYNFDDTKKGGVVDKLLIPLGGEHHDFFRWVAANRAERLAKEGRENLFTPASIAALKTLEQGTTAFDYTLQHAIHGAPAGTITRDRTLIYRDALATFNEFNTNVLDLAEQSGLIDGQSRHLWEHEFYVPFYRVAEEDDGGVRGMNIKSGVVRQQAFKELKGGKDALNADLLDNTLMNWAHLLDAAAKNRAAKATLEAAERMGLAVNAPQYAAQSIGSATGSKKGVVWFMDGGIKRHYVIDQQSEQGPFVLTALTSLEYAGMRSPVMNAMGAFKHALTVGVTASPFFKVRNLIRDSLQAIGTAPLSYNVAGNIKQGFALTKPQSDAYFRLMAGGGTIHFGTMLEGSEAKRIQALVESGVDDSTILNSDQKVKAFYRKWIEPGITAYNELGNRGEAINRASLYDQLVKNGMSHADASLQARDLMDFSMQGSFTTIRFLTQVVPFFNARVQGLYKLGRAAKEDPARFAAVLGTVSLMSVALLAAYAGDDDWKKREDWDRNNFWWFKFGGMAFRIPKPFEIGAIATLAERGFELAFSKEMTKRRFMQQVLALAGDNLALNPIPQMIKPAIDVYANVDSFTQRPIETMGMERLKPGYRFNDRTTMLARGTSAALNAVTGVVNQDALSPVQVDHLLRGYFGWLGSFVVGGSEAALRPATGQPGHATPDYWKSLTGGMAAGLDDAPSRYVSQMYQQAKAIEQAYGTWKLLQKEGKAEQAAAFQADNRELLGSYHTAERLKRLEGQLNQRIKVIESSDVMSGDEKRDQIRAIQRQKDRIARNLPAL